MSEFDLQAIRQQFPALSRRHHGKPVCYFDGPAGSQVPTSVAKAVSDYLLHTNANSHGRFASAFESDAVLDDARSAVADFVGAADDREIVWGQNMTSLTLALSRALAREWGAGDEIVVTRLDHDANVSPWLLAARDAGATIRWVDVNRDDCSLNLESFAAALSSRTKLVAVTAASNLSGSTTPVAKLAAQVHAVGAELFVDAVHYAPHRAIDVAAWGCDFLACSVYKFFGPHVGVLWGRHDRMAELDAYRVRPAGDNMPDRFNTGTQNHEGIAGARAAVDYLASICGGEPDRGTRRARLLRSFALIEEHEEALCRQLLSGLAELGGFCVRGVSEFDDRNRMTQRLPTVALTHSAATPAQLGAGLAERGIFTWDGHQYAVELARAIELDSGGVLRIGLLHYSSSDEVSRLLSALGELI